MSEGSFFPVRESPFLNQSSLLPFRWFRRRASRTCRTSGRRRRGRAASCGRSGSTRRTAGRKRIRGFGKLEFEWTKTLILTFYAIISSTRSQTRSFFKSSRTHNGYYPSSKYRVTWGVTTTAMYYSIFWNCSLKMTIWARATFFKKNISHRWQ